MIVGETRIIRHTETGDAAFTFDSTPTLNVTLPDGTDVSPDPTVTVSPGTSATVQTLSATVAFPQAGEYRMTWEMDVGAQDPIIRKETYFAAWTDVYTAIRELLNRSITQLPDARIDRELARLTRWFSARFTCLGSYSALTEPDSSYFDDALVYLIAARLRPALGSSGSTSTSEVVSKKQGTLEVRYASGSSTLTGQKLMDYWNELAWESLLLIGCIADTVEPDATIIQLVQPFSTLSPLAPVDCEDWARQRKWIE